MSTKQLQVRWEKHQAGVLTHLRNLLNSEAFADVTLCCEDKRLRAHRIILSASSPYLQRVLLDHPGSDAVTIILHEISYEDMHSLLEFMYTGSVVVHHNRLSSLLRAAETLDVKVLAQTEQVLGNVHILEYNAHQSPNSPQNLIVGHREDNRIHSSSDMRNNNICAKEMFDRNRVVHQNTQDKSSTCGISTNPYKAENSESRVECIQRQNSTSSEGVSPNAVDSYDLRTHSTFWFKANEGSTRYLTARESPKDLVSENTINSSPSTTGTDDRIRRLSDCAPHLATENPKNYNRSSASSCIPQRSSGTFSEYYSTAKRYCYSSSQGKSRSPINSHFVGQREDMGVPLESDTGREISNKSSENSVSPRISQDDKCRKTVIENKSSSFNVSSLLQPSPRHSDIRVSSHVRIPYPIVRREHSSDIREHEVTSGRTSHCRMEESVQEHREEPCDVKNSLECRLEGQLGQQEDRSVLCDKPITAKCEQKIEMFQSHSEGTEGEMSEHENAAGRSDGSRESRSEEIVNVEDNYEGKKIPSDFRENYTSDGSNVIEPSSSARDLTTQKNNVDEYYRRRASYPSDSKTFKTPPQHHHESRGVHIVRPLPSLRPIAHLAQYNGQVVTNYNRPNGFLPNHSSMKLTSYYMSDIVPDCGEQINKDLRNHVMLGQSKNVIYPQYLKDTLPGRNLFAAKEASSLCVNGFPKPVFNLTGMPVGLGCSGPYQRIPSRLASIVPPSPWSQNHRPPPCVTPRRVPEFQPGLGWALPPPPLASIQPTEHPAAQPFAAAFRPISVVMTGRENSGEAVSPKLKQLLRRSENCSVSSGDNDNEKVPSTAKRGADTTPDICSRSKEQRISKTDDCNQKEELSDISVNAESPTSRLEKSEDEFQNNGSAINLSCQSTEVQGAVKVEGNCDNFGTNEDSIKVDEDDVVIVVNDSNNNGKDVVKVHGCEDCGKNFSRRQLLLQHRRIHTGERPYACKQCGKQFTQRGHWSTHQKLHEPARSPEHTCTSCGKAFGTRASLKVHLRTHTGEKPFQCNECGKQFSQLRNFKYHRSVHEGTREFAATCPECGKYFNDRGYLSSHMKIHRNRKEYGCQYCGKSFNQRVAYNMHVRIHTGERPHSCPHCSKSFSRKMLLKQHLRIHTGEKPFSCEVCGKAFADRSNMTLHMRLHSGIKPYTCTVCSKAFTKKHHLKTHMNYHTGIKPYACSKCGLRFSQSSNMRTHFKKCTGGNNNSSDTNANVDKNSTNISITTLLSTESDVTTTSTTSSTVISIANPPQSDESSCGTVSTQRTDENR